MSEPTTNPTPKLTRKDFNGIALAVGRLEDIKALSPLAITSEVEAETKGLVEYLSKEFIDHATEFLGCWYCVTTEYEPFIKNFMPIANRANAMIANQIKAQQQTEEQAVSEALAAANKSNIITL